MPPTISISSWELSAPLIGIPGNNLSTSPRVGDAWRGNAIGMWRIVFGLVWTIDATFKWQPAFQTGFVSYLTGGLKGQPALVKAWTWFWIDIVKVDGGLKDDAKRANLIAYLATLK